MAPQSSEFLADLHAHTTRSDGVLEPRGLLRLAKSRGLGAIAITDHNVLTRVEGEGILVVPGEEVSTTAGHILAYLVQEEIPRGLDPEEAVDRIVEAGGIAVPAHPFKISVGIGGAWLRRLAPRIGAIEVLNGRTSRFANRRAMAYARELGKPPTAGSDAHLPEEVGRCFLALPSDPGDPEELMEMVLRGEGAPRGRGLTLPAAVRMYVRSVANWGRRGFRRI